MSSIISPQTVFENGLRGGIFKKEQYKIIKFASLYYCETLGIGCTYKQGVTLTKEHLSYFFMFEELINN